MEKRKLGNTDLYLSEIGFGCASIWGKDFFEEEKAIELFMTAYSQGINFFDTGSSYGNSEERLGKCIARIGKDHRSELVIATKCGTRRSETSGGGYYTIGALSGLKRALGSV